jgi:DNA-binding transcriptional LysR family regulator
MPGLDYRSIYVEKNELLCGRDHPLFRVNDANQIRQIIQSSRKVTRGYLEGRDVQSLGVNQSLSSAVVQNLEAAAILILAGGHIGFLPWHFAMPWKTRDEMKAILPLEIVYESNFHIVIRRGRRKSMILKNFLADLETAIQDTEGLQAAR